MSSVSGHVGCHYSIRCLRCQPLGHVLARQGVLFDIASGASPVSRPAHWLVDSSPPDTDGTLAPHRRFRLRFAYQERKKVDFGGCAWQTC